MAVATVIRETIVMQYVWISTFPGRDVGCTTVKEDNKRAINLATYSLTTPNSKRVDVRHPFLRERVANGEFKLVHVPSAEQHAEYITKPLGTEAFRLHRTFVILW